jgi:Fe2+ transport system protein FeoA
MEKEQPLTCFYVGSHIVVSKIATSRDDSRKLMIFGLIVGTAVTLLQLQPVVVLQIDYTEVALDRVLAGNILGVAKN